MDQLSPPAEKVFTLTLSESEMVLVIAQLWRCDHEQTILAHTAKREGNVKHERARRESAAKASALANRLEQTAAKEGRGEIDHITL